MRCAFRRYEGTVELADGCQTVDVSIWNSRAENQGIISLDLLSPEMSENLYISVSMHPSTNHMGRARLYEGHPVRTGSSMPVFWIRVTAESLFRELSDVRRRSVCHFTSIMSPVFSYLLSAPVAAIRYRYVPDARSTAFNSMVWFVPASKT